MSDVFSIFLQANHLCHINFNQTKLQWAQFKLIWTSLVFIKICALFNPTDAVPCCQIIFFFIFLILLFNSKLFSLGSWFFFVDLLFQTFLHFLSSSILTPCLGKEHKRQTKERKIAKWKTNKHTVNKIIWLLRTNLIPCAKIGNSYFSGKGGSIAQVVAPMAPEKEGSHLFFYSQWLALRIACKCFIFDLPVWIWTNGQRTTL
jgi:hypothetical protein